MMELRGTLHVDGRELAAGDLQSLRVLFKNLTGANFTDNSSGAEAHAAYLQSADDWFGVKLAMGDLLILRDAAGRVVCDLPVGCGLHRADPEVGKPYRVLTNPVGAGPTWHATTCTSHVGETARSRELYYFHDGRHTYPVRRDELAYRVLPAAH